MTHIKRLRKLKARIEFLRSCTSEAELIHSVEQSLAEFCDLECFFNLSFMLWNYNITCDVKYAFEPWAEDSNRLNALYGSIELLVEEGS